MTDRILYEFPHSHFCEKARWALDYKGLAFKRVPLLPPWHGLVTRRYGKRTSVPVLLDGRHGVQGSAEIISYLDECYPVRPLTTGDPDEMRRLEKSFDRELGVSIRAFLYFYCLRHKKFVTAAFMQNSPRWHRLIFRLQYPALAWLIKRSYCPDQASADAAVERLLSALDRIWADLNGRPYVLATGFSRLDITVCSLLSFVTRPPELPLRWPEIPEDPFLQEWNAKIRSHPISDWVAKIYRDHRGVYQG